MLAALLCEELELRLREDAHAVGDFSFDQEERPELMGLSDVDLENVLRLNGDGAPLEIPHMREKRPAGRLFCGN